MIPHPLMHAVTIPMKKYNVYYSVIGCIIWALVAIAELRTIFYWPIFWAVAGGYIIFFLVFLYTCPERVNASNINIIRGALIFELVLVLILLTYNPGPRTPLLLVLWASQLPNFFSNRLSIILVLLSHILMMCVYQSGSIIFSGLFLALQLFVLAAIISHINERATRESVEALNGQLLTTRLLLAQASRQEERLRISRDLHDILGHQLTALSLHLEMLYHKTDDTLKQDVLQAKGIAKELLDSIRQVVRDQRRDLHLDIGEAMRTLVARLPTVTLFIDGELHIQSPQLAEQLILILQEGISNALRHGHADTIQLRFFQEGKDIRIFLDDNGKGCDNFPNHGTGLIGMRERLAPYNGTIELSPLKKGCRLAISLGVPND